MAAPVQGGIGAYHWIIQNGLILYGLTIQEGRTFATIVHSSQMVMIIVVGLISFFIVILFLQKKKISSVEDPIHDNITENIKA